jgi:glycosyltransferase involved in cell wall biosynthesis
MTSKLKSDRASVPASSTFVPGGEFFFSLGEFRPRKNYESLLGLLTHFPDTHLIVAGKRGCYRDYDAALDRRITELGLGNRVHFPGVINEPDKAYLYRHCRAFLFPSRNEGFGMPVIEAMAFGKPVFLARMTSLPEVGGELACYWDDFASDAMAAVVKSGLAAHDERRARAVKAWARRFSWADAAHAYLDLYRRALSQTV